MDTEKIGAFIKELRTEKKLTQKELAERLNITDRAVSKWERGKGCPDISYLEDLSIIFEVSILELLKGERTNEINDKDILYSLKYGNETTKERIFRIINNSIKVIVITVILYLLIGNIINIYYAKKEFDNPYDTEKIALLTDENMDMLKLIKNNQGIYTNEDYQKLIEITNFYNLEGYLKELKLLLKKDKLSPDDIYITTYISDESYEVLFKYNTFDYNHIRNFNNYRLFSYNSYTEFYEKFCKNIYRYQIDNNIDAYIDYKVSSDELLLKGINMLLKDIIEVGEINE